MMLKQPPDAVILQQHPHRVLVAHVDDDQPFLLVGGHLGILQRAPDGRRAGVHNQRPGRIILHRSHAGQV